MDSTDLDDFRLIRNKSEQFRKARNNFFRRGHEICRKSDAEMFILIKRNNKFSRFMDGDDLRLVPETVVVSTT